MPGADNPKEFVEQIASLWRQRRTFKGLVGLTFFLNSLLLLLFSGAFFMLDKCGVVETSRSCAVFFATGALIIGIINVGMFVTWTYWRMLPINSKETITVLFAPHADRECSELVNRLFERFRDDLRTRRLDGLLQCRHLPEHYTVRDHQDAHALLQRSGARLIVHGRLQRGQVKGEQLEGFRSISFTLRHRNLSPAEFPAVARDLGAALAFRAFCVNEKNSFIQRDVVVNNISEVSLFFIALGLTLDGHVAEAIAILDPLLVEADKRASTADGKPQFRVFVEAIRSCLTVALHAAFTLRYNKSLVNHVTDRSYDAEATACDELLQKLVRLNKRTDAFYLGRAIIRFHFGDMAGAKDAVEHAARLAPSDHAAPPLSKAFLLLWARDYRKAFLEYMRAGKCREYNTETVTSVLLFLNTMLSLHPDRSELRFALAFVNDRFFDQEVARDEFRNFLENSTDPELTDFVKFAQKRMEKIQGDAKQIAAPNQPSDRT